METKRLKLIFLVICLTIAGLTYFKIAPKSDCVNVYIDFGSLNNKSKVSQCIPTDRDTALNILTKSEIKLDGTDKYGLKVICRVNGLPTPAQETCSIMPPEDAYWAFITKGKSSIINPFPQWGWAQKGVSEVYFNPGDSIGLIFTEGGKLSWPN